MTREMHFRWIIRAILGIVTLLLLGWIGNGVLVPSGVFVARHDSGKPSPWVRDLWPPLHVYPPEEGQDGVLRQRVVVSPVTVRVRLPRASFRSVDVSLAVDAIPPGSTVAVERHLHRQDYLTVPLLNGHATLPLQGVFQHDRDLQFMFTFPGLTRNAPVVVQSFQFRFIR